MDMEMTLFVHFTSFALKTWPLQSRLPSLALLSWRDRRWMAVMMLTRRFPAISWFKARRSVICAAGGNPVSQGWRPPLKAVAWGRAVPTPNRAGR
jgi:hypothetical protein